jgi:hypothetical protein
MPDQTMNDQVDALEKAFNDTVQRWGRAAQSFHPAASPLNPTSSIVRIVTTILKVSSRLFKFLKQLITQGPAALADILGDLVETLTSEASAMLDDLAETAGQALETGLGAVLGFVELVKKTIYLITDFFDRRFPVKDLTDLIRLQIDIINNLLGHVAELVSPKTGKVARRLRLDMYEQLAAIRVAEGVTPHRPVETDGDQPA